MLLEAVSAVKDLGRLQQIVSILLRHGLGEMVHRLGMNAPLEKAGKKLHWNYAEQTAQLEFPERVRMALEEMGPTFIKLGQVLATRVDLFAPEWIREFEKLQHKAPPVSFEEIKPRVEEDLGGPIEQRFLNFDPEPLASASIAQVHRAALKDGSQVVVKVRRPNIVKVVDADLHLLERLARLAEHEYPEVCRYRPREIVRQFTTSMQRELNLETECRNAERMAANFRNQADIIIPEVHWDYVTPRMNVQEFIDGVAGLDGARIQAAGIDRKVIARTGTTAVLKMILFDGFFHADPHPGNLIYLSENRIAFIDFGMVGRLTENRKQQVIDLLKALADRNAGAGVNVLLDWVGDMPVDIDKLTDDVDSFIDGFHGVPLKQLSLPNMLGELTTLIRNHELMLPPDLTLLFKALITLEGMGRQNDPDFDILAHATPQLQQAILARYRPDLFVKTGLHNTAEMIDIFAQVPGELHRILKAARAGSLKFNIDLVRLDHFGWQMDRAASRVAVGVVTAALLMSSSVFMFLETGPVIMGMHAFSAAGFAGAGLGLLWLVRSIWRGSHNHRVWRGGRDRNV